MKGIVLSALSTSRNHRNRKKAILSVGVIRKSSESKILKTAGW